MAGRGKYQKYTDDTKAAVMAALLAGQGVDEIAKEFDIPQRTVSSWKATISETELAEIRSKKEIDFGALLADYLVETLTTLSVQAKHFRNETWLRQQPAADLAVLHGVQTDKAIRLLEAIERANHASGS